MPFHAYAEKVNEIIIDGNSRISDETILIYEINNNDDLPEIKINKITQDLYSTEFSDVSVEIKNSKLIISLKEYPLVNQLILIGEKTNKLKEQILKH